MYERKIPRIAEGLSSKRKRNLSKMKGVAGDVTARLVVKGFIT